MGDYLFFLVEVGNLLQVNHNKIADKDTDDNPG